jgi:hypothetical protein
MPLARGVKKKEHENLTEANIAKVIRLLQPTSAEEKPITKKEACDILNIAYNTTRLDRIIDEYLEKKAYTEKRRSQNRGKGATKAEIKSVIEDYLDGDNIATISKRLFRSAGFIKAIIERLGIPQRTTEKGTYFLPDECVADEFLKGQRVWSAVYNAPATILNEIDGDYLEKYGCRAYRIYVSEPMEDDNNSWFPGVRTGGFHAACAAYDLGSLKHLEKYGVTI